jgi:hypothetical protein
MIHIMWPTYGALINTFYRLALNNFKVIFWDWPEFFLVWLRI